MFFSSTHHLKASTDNAFLVFALFRKTSLTTERENLDNVGLSLPEQRSRLSISKTALYSIVYLSTQRFAIATCLVSPLSCFVILSKSVVKQSISFSFIGRYASESRNSLH